MTTDATQLQNRKAELPEVASERRFDRIVAICGATGGIGEALVGV